MSGVIDSFFEKLGSTSEMDRCVIYVIIILRLARDIGEQPFWNKSGLMQGAREDSRRVKNKGKGCGDNCIEPTVLMIRLTPIQSGPKSGASLFPFGGNGANNRDRDTKAAAPPEIQIGCKSNYDE